GTDVVKAHADVIDVQTAPNANGDVVGRKYDNGESPGSIGAGIYEYFGEFSPSSAYSKKIGPNGGVVQAIEVFSGADKAVEIEAFPESSAPYYEVNVKDKDAGTHGLLRVDKDGVSFKGNGSSQTAFNDT